MEHKGNLDSDFGKIEKVLTKHPFLKFCFGKYINWAFSKSTLDNSKDLHLIDMLLRTGSISDRAQELEDKLIRAKEVLNLSEEGFRARFRFQDDLLTNDEEKIHDILAEPLFVLDLDNSNFKNIEKLPRKIVKDGKQVRLADFKAQYGKERFAIELKTTRMERDIENGKPLEGNKVEARKMLLNNCLAKIEERSLRVFEQLENTYSFFNCTKKMLAFYNRRLRVVAYLETSDFIDVAQNIIETYKGQIDYLAMKNYDATELVFHPPLHPL